MGLAPTPNAESPRCSTVELHRQTSIVVFSSIPHVSTPLDILPNYAAFLALWLRLLTAHRHDRLQ